jgi:hypothetical protein
LADTLKNVLSIRLFSFQIPYTWYTITSLNSFFWFSDEKNNFVKCSIPLGNYSYSSLVVAVNTSILNAGITDCSCGYNSLNGKWTFSFGSGYIYQSILFYDIGNKTGDNININGMYFNESLGYSLGFRTDIINTSANSSFESSATVDINGPKYLILVIDDFNQNHVNNSLISITQPSSVFNMPSYYRTDMPSYTIPSGTSTNTSSIYKYNYEYSKTNQILPTAPRTLTQSQIYTINEISKNRNNNTSYFSKAPTSSDIFAILPIKPNNAPIGTLLVEFSGSLKDLQRTYFGPVSIERFGIKLLDDKGNVLDLNGADWCITIICECLYQY